MDGRPTVFSLFSSTPHPHCARASMAALQGNPPPPPLSTASLPSPQPAASPGGPPTGGDGGGGGPGGPQAAAAFLALPTLRILAPAAGRPRPLLPARSSGILRVLDAGDMKSGGRQEGGTVPKGRKEKKVGSRRAVAAARLARARGTLSHSLPPLLSLSLHQVDFSPTTGVTTPSPRRHPFGPTGGLGRRIRSFKLPGAPPTPSPLPGTVEVAAAAAAAGPPPPGCLGGGRRPGPPPPPPRPPHPLMLPRPIILLLSPRTRRPSRRRRRPRPPSRPSPRPAAPPWPGSTAGRAETGRVR